MSLADDVRNALDELAAGVTAAALPESFPPQRVRIRLAAPGANETNAVTDLLPNGIRPLSLVPGTVDAPIDLSFVTKNVTFGTPRLPAPAPGADLVDLADVQAGAGVNGLVTGIIGRISGTVGVPIGQLVEQAGDMVVPSADVTLTLTVRVRDEQGSEIGGARIGLAGQPLRTGGTLVTAPVAANAVPDLVVQVPVGFVELTTSAPPLVHVRVAVSVQLSATVAGQTVRSGTVELPELALSVPAIPVPVVAAFFSQTNLNRDGADQPLTPRSEGLNDRQVQVFLFVPASSPLPDPRSALEAVLAPLDSLERLLVALDLATFVLGAANLGPLLAPLRAVDRAVRDGADPRRLVGFVKADAARDWYESFFMFPVDPGRDTAEDKVRSLALLAPPGRAVEVFEHDDFRGSALRVQTRTPTTDDQRALLTIVRRLDSRGTPASEPPGQVIRLSGEAPMDAKISSSLWPGH